MLRELSELFGPHSEEYGPVDLKKMRWEAILRFVIFMVLWILFILFLGKWLWNDVLAKHVTIVKPVENIWQFLGIAVLLAILFK